MSIPKPTGRNASSSRRGGKLPKPEGGDFDPFFGAKDVGKEGTKGKFTVLGAPELTPDSEFSDMQMPILYKGSRFALGMKVSGGNYARLYKRFGDNEKKWKGTVAFQVKHFKKNDYIAVV